MTPEEAERAHLRGPEGDPEQQGHRRMQELRKIGREYPFICPVDFKPHRGSPPGEDPNMDPTFVANHREDDGADIPEDVRTRIFEPFFTTKPQGVGTGLGLDISWRIVVNKHHGHIEVESAGEGKGTEFKICLPISLRETPDAEDQPLDASPVTNNPQRILVVDDNEPAAQMLALLITMSGHQVRTASDGEEALQQAAEFRPNVVIMDLGMPNMNGYEAARHLRQRWGQSIKLIALTGWGQEEDKRRTHEAGFNHHLVKPVTSGDLQVLDADYDLRVKRQR